MREVHAEALVVLLTRASASARARKHERVKLHARNVRVIHAVAVKYHSVEWYTLHESYVSAYVRPSATKRAVGTGS